MKNKYELTDMTIRVDGTILHRIKALRDVGYVKAGDLGGFIESKKNLSYESDCWIFGDAWVYEKARVSEMAKISGTARVSGRTQISGSAQVRGYTQISGDAWVSGDAQVYGCARICGNCVVCGDVCINGHMKLTSGIWNKMIKINNKYYSISTILNKILVE